MKTVEDFILGLDGQQKAIVSFLHQHLSAYHDLQSKINWNIPFYYRKSRICYLNPVIGQGIELAFTRGKNLSNAQGVLLDKGRKVVAGMDFFSTETFDLRIIDEIVQEAILLDEIAKK